jgi:hypothetical protein
MDAQEFRNLQEAYLEVYQELDEAEGSYGQTPKATAAYGKLANKRRETPASGFAKRGDKTKQVKSAEKHHYRTLNPDAGNRGKKSTKPSPYSGRRSGMTQSGRDYARGEAEYGHTGYDPDFDGGPSAPGGKPKGKKLERQKKTGVSAESFDLFDYILEHLVAEGYADTNEAAIAIMANMSEEWKQSIVEETKRTEYLQKKFNKENERKSGSALKHISGKQNTGQALQKARESERHMRGER